LNSAPFRLAVLASGRGSNLQALLDAQDAGVLATRIVGVFSDRPACGAIARAAARGIPTVAKKPADYPSREAFDASLFSEIQAVQPDLIVCAGYMRMISEAAVKLFPGRMINIHPSLLPKYPGLHTHVRALAAGDREHGASVHVVIPALDAGPVVAQARIDVLPGDDNDALARRVLEREHPLLVQSVKAISDGTIALSDHTIFRHGAALSAPLQLNGLDQLEETT
jgi:phosphoribosylglycinamide formyltransferase-1